MKKLFALLLTVALLLSTVVMGMSTLVYAREASPEEDFIAYEGVIEEYVGPGGDVVIPETIDGEKVYEIAANAFFQNTDISSVDFPEGLEIIGNSAFKQCTNLVKVTFPYSLTDIGGGAFAECGLTEVLIPGNVKMVKFGAFSKNSLKKIEFSYGVKEIHSSAFNHNYICDVVFPESVDLICGFSFVFPLDTGSWSFTICNPYCQIGAYAESIDGCAKQQWKSTGISLAYSSINNAQTIQYVIPKGSEMKKVIEETFRAHLDSTNGSDCDVSGNTIMVSERDENYFAGLEQNQKDFGITEETYTPSSNNGSSSDIGNDNTDGDEDKSDNSGKNNSSNKNDKNNNSTTTIVEDGDNSSLWIVLAIVGGVFLLLIIGVVVFAVVFLNKPRKTSGDNIAELEAFKNQNATDEEPPKEDTDN